MTIDYEKLALEYKPCYPRSMGKWLQKMRVLLAILALGLSWHHVGLASHIACDAHINCDGDSRHSFGAAEATDHDHCLIQIKPTRLIDDDRAKDRVDCWLDEFLTARVISQSPFILAPPQGYISSSLRSTANIQFAESVRILT